MQIDTLLQVRMPMILIHIPSPSIAGGYSADGMMEGPVYAKLLDALKEEMAINPTDWTPVFNDGECNYCIYALNDVCFCMHRL